MKAKIASIRQVDGSTRIIYAQDEAHAKRARSLIRHDPAMINYLHGIDGIMVTVRDIPSPK